MIKKKAIILAVSLVVLWVLYAAHVQYAQWVYEDTDWSAACTSIGPWMWRELRIPSRNLPRRLGCATGGSPPRAHLLSLAVLTVNGLALAPLGLAATTVVWFHPLSIEAGAYAVELGELLSALGLIIAVHGAVSPRHGWVRWGVIGSGFYGAAMSKETGAVGALLILWLWCCRPAYRSRADMVGLSAIGGVGMMYVALVWQPPFSSLVPLWRWMAVQAVGGWGLLFRVLVPLNLSPDHPWWTAPDSEQILAVLGVAGSACYAWRARFTRLGFALGWWWLALLPRLLIRVPLGYLTEHQAYTALVGMGLAAALPPGKPLSS